MVKEHFLLNTRAMLQEKVFDIPYYDSYHEFLDLSLSS